MRDSTANAEQSMSTHDAATAGGSASPQSQPSISVILPFQDPRGEPEHLASWTRRQTLAPHLFEVVVVTNKQAPEHEKEIRRYLRPKDQLITADVVGPYPMYAIGARAARGSTLFFSEDHCLADPGCLSAVSEFMQDESMDGATVRWRHINRTVVARMEQLVNELDARTWNQPEHWNKVRIRGFALKRRVYNRVGGIEAEYGGFAEAILAARLHAGGYRLGFIDKAGVQHINTFTLDELFKSAWDYSLNESRFCAQNDPYFCERYFSASTVLCQGLAVPRQLGGRLASAIWQVLRRECRQPAPSIKLMLTWTKALVRPLAVFSLGRWPLILQAQLAVALAFLRFHLVWFNEQLRLRAFTGFWSSIVHWARLHYIVNNMTAIVGTNALCCSDAEVPGSWNAVGLLPLERYSGKSFRWTGPVAAMFFNLPAGDYQGVIDTGGLRGPADEIPLALLWNEHLIAREQIRGSRDKIVFSISSRMFSPGMAQRLTIATVPLNVKGSEERRCLGVPICSLRFVSTDGTAVEPDQRSEEALAVRS